MSKHSRINNHLADIEKLLQLQTCSNDSINNRFKRIKNRIQQINIKKVIAPYGKKFNTDQFRCLSDFVISKYLTEETWKIMCISDDDYKKKVDKHNGLIDICSSFDSIDLRCELSGKLYKRFRINGVILRHCIDINYKFLICVERHNLYIFNINDENKRLL